MTTLTSIAFKEMVTKLAQQYGLDLSLPSTYLRLEMNYMDPLVIEKMTPHVLSVAHYYRPDGASGIYLADPEIVFFTKGQLWQPVTITQSMGGQRRCATLSVAGDTILEVDEEQQFGAVDLADGMWAENIKAQAWLARAHKVAGVTPNTERRFALGQLHHTPGATAALQAAEQSPMALLARHQRGDWGELDKADQRQNDLSVKQLWGRIMSAYRLTTGQKIWVITEWDHSYTTILLPEEY